MRELYKPKTSLKKKAELESNMNALSHKPREASTNRTDYLAQLRMNKKADDEGSKLSGVASLPSLKKRDLQSEQKMLKSPISSKPDSSRNFRRGR